MLHGADKFRNTWWRHEMETFFALQAICAGNSPVPDEFPTQRPVTRSFDVFFDLRLNKRLSKQSWGWWFETPSRPLWRHCNEGARQKRVNCIITEINMRWEWQVVCFLSIRRVGTITTINVNTLQWHHNGRDGVPNHRRLDCLLNRLFRHR